MKTKLSDMELPSGAPDRRGPCARGVFKSVVTHAKQAR